MMGSYYQEKVDEIESFMNEKYPTPIDHEHDIKGDRYGKE